MQLKNKVKSLLLGVATDDKHLCPVSEIFQVHGKEETNE